MYFERLRRKYSNELKHTSKYAWSGEIISACIENRRRRRRHEEMNFVLRITLNY